MKLTEPQLRMLRYCHKYGRQWVGGRTARPANALIDLGLLKVTGHGFGRNPRREVQLTNDGRRWTETHALEETHGA